MFRVCIRDAPHDAHDEPHVSRCASRAGKETLREVFFSFLSFSSRAHAAHRVIAATVAARVSSSRAGATHRTWHVASASSTRSFSIAASIASIRAEFSSTLVPRSKPSLARSTTTERRGDASASSASSASSAARGGDAAAIRLSAIAARLREVGKGAPFGSAIARFFFS